MRKFSNIISLAACFVLLWGCDEYDDGELRQNIDAIEQELTETEKRVERLNEEMNSLSALINSSFKIGRSTRLNSSHTDSSRMPSSA